MESGQPSRTALATAFFRAQHHAYDDEPKLVDDPYAHRLLSAGEMTAIAQRYERVGRELGIAADGPRAVLARTLRTASPAAFVLARARYTEDRLTTAVDRGVAQYVLVGAGLDTFAFRRDGLRNRLQVFELDHQSSQALKRERLATAGVMIPPNVHFGAVDFEREIVADALARLPFRAAQPAVFAWLGVTMYLTRAAIEATWRAMRACAAPGSELVFDFMHPDALSETASPRVQKMRERTRAVGEAIITGIDPAALRAELEASGWTLVEHLDGAEIHRRWFATRTEGYVVGPHGHLACAGVGCGRRQAVSHQN